jgi:hypothetical protein
MVMQSADSDKSPSAVEPLVEGGRLVEGSRELRPVGELLAAMAAVIANGDAQAARRLVQEAETNYPDDNLLTSAVRRCQAVVKRGEWLEAILELLRRDVEEDRFADGLGHFRQALSLGRGLPALKALADREAERQLTKLLPQNWRVAEALLQEAAAAEPPLSIDAGLLEQLRAAREDEVVTSAIRQAERALWGALTPEGGTAEMRRKLTELLVIYPGNERIREALDSLDRPGTAVARAAAQVVQPTTRRAHAGTAPGPDADALPPSTSWPAKLGLSNSAVSAIKSFGALAATTGMLCCAGFLIWQHFSKTSATPATAVRHARPQGPLPVPVIAEIVPEEEQAWDLVKATDDASDIRSFLVAYPASSHAVRARMKLAAMEWETLDKGNRQVLENYLRAYPETPYRAEAQRLLLAAAANQAAILQAVHRYFANLTDDPAQTGDGILEVPVIDGDRATLRYRPKDPAAGEVQIFSLIRQQGVWKVQQVR